ncbi:LLM class flavin-dependent oxidoreductase [Pseudonocardia sp. HH130629-09]|uniref:LLM class flavin-dependent oxidoreductase n=1 Tax=Pseudonocardia sp. HH130629-09 TaxID=1641402 RepID=UPI0009EBFA04|nr:LLM class flavin-dependent oxidoreductase [Pseudonocardia sp. HH130629-09]
MSGRIIVNGFEMNCLAHMAHGLWAHPRDRRRGYTGLEYWIELAALLERGRLDALFIADVLGVYDTFRSSPDAAVAAGAQIPANDPALVVPAMAVGTTNLSFAVSVSTSYESPFGHARRFSTLDHLTQGRVGWNVVTSYLPNAAKNFGWERMVLHDERYDRADEYLDVCYQLWEASWEEDAVSVDGTTQRYADPAKVHPIDHRGDFFSVAGPHLCEPSPQRTPVIYQAGNSARGRKFAARHAECVFLSGVVPASLRRSADDVRTQASAAGRAPDDVKILTSLSVIVAEDETAVCRKREELQRWVNVDGMLAQYCGTTGFDLAAMSRSDVVTYRDTDHGQGGAALFTSDVQRPVTVGDIVDSMTQLGETTLLAIGTPVQVADQMEEWIDEIGLDGFNIIQFLTPETFTDFIDMVVPELQRRGRYQTEYTPGTFREKLFGPGRALLPDRHPGGLVRPPACVPSDQP